MHRYPISIRIIHWLTSILLVATVSIVLIRDQMETKAVRVELLNLHRAIGLGILLLLVIRLFFRAKHVRNLPKHGLSLLNELAAKVAHLSIYIALIALPILGLLQTNATGKEATFLGLFTLPKLINPNDDLAESLQDYHAYAAWILIALICLHILAALWHHFILKDNVLESMKIKFNN